MALATVIAALLLTISTVAGQAPGAPAQGRGGAGFRRCRWCARRGATSRSVYANPEGKPDLNGYWGGCCNLGLQDLETQRGVIVEPANAKIPYNTEYAAKAKDLRANHMFDEPGTALQSGRCPVPDVHAIWISDCFKSKTYTVHLGFHECQSRYPHGRPTPYSRISEALHGGSHRPLGTVMSWSSKPRISTTGPGSMPLVTFTVMGFMSWSDSLPSI